MAIFRSTPPVPIKGWESSSSIHVDLAEEIDMKIAQFEKMLTEKDEVIRKQQELIEEQRNRLDRFEEGRDSGHDFEDNGRNLGGKEED